MVVLLVSFFRLIFSYAAIIVYSLKGKGRGGGCKEGDFVKNLLKAPDFPLLNVGTEQSMLRNPLPPPPSKRGIILNNVHKTMDLHNNTWDYNMYIALIYSVIR